MLLLILLILAAGLIVFFWAGTYFFQGYLYTEPSPGLYWQAPAAGAGVAAFLSIWCLAVASADKASPSDIPYDTLFRFSPKVDMFDKPAKELWAIKKGGKEVRYVRKTTVQFHQTGYFYQDTSGGPWNSKDVEAIDLMNQGQKVRFFAQAVAEDVMTGITSVKRNYREFVSEDGWVMRDYEEASTTAGPTGLPQQSRFGRFLLNLFFNIGFWLVLFLSLWLLLRFLWGHALGLSLVIWVTITLAVLPMLLTAAAQVAKDRQALPAAPEPAALSPRQAPDLPG
jgi:hypothetical protein